MEKGIQKVKLLYNLSKKKNNLYLEIKVNIIKLWIIYKKGIGFSKIISDMLQDRLEDYIDVFAGNLDKNNPSSVIEDDLDLLVICDVIYEEDMGEEMKIWISKFLELARSRAKNLKSISGFYINTTDSTNIPSWVEYLRNNLKITNIFPEIVDLKLNTTKFIVDIETTEFINKYSRIFIDYIITI